MIAAPMIAALLLAAGRAAAAPVDEALFAFPGSVRNPSSAVSAGLALTDRWLGDAPFDNPAVLPQQFVELSPALVRESRQDLRAANRHYDETAAFLDGAGGWIVTRLGKAALFAYVDQPVLRVETMAFERGRATPDPANPPAVINADTDARETRAGAGVSWPLGGVRLGLAGEWRRRDDHYEVLETSGAPTAADVVTNFSGTGFSGSLGGRGAVRIGSRTLEIGAALRLNPAMDVTGAIDTTYTVIGTKVSVPISARRAQAWEGGVSASFIVNPQFRVLAAAGGASASAWDGFGVTNGAASSVSAGVELHDPETTWTVRAGFGVEQQAGAPESRAGRAAVGFGWTLDSVRFDLGAVRRNLERANRPDSYDDRLVGSVRVTF